MSRGSTFTLYRAYNKFKADNTQISSLKEEYYKYNKKHNYFGETNLFTGKPHTQDEIDRNEAQLREDVPDIMELDFNGEREHFDREKYDSVKDIRNKKYANFVRASDGVFLDKLLEWDFTSGFDCLISEYSLNYGFRNNAVVIDSGTAKEMLAAIEYLLGGKYDDSVEASMNSHFIKIFSDGNSCDSYWKYVNRHEFDKKKTEYEFSNANGVKVKVTLPLTQKKSEGEDEDDIYAREIDESNSEQEYYLRRTATVLRTFLEADEWSFNDDTELVLVYSCWG